MSVSFEPRADAILLDTGPLLAFIALRYLQETAAGEARRRKILSDIQPGLEWTAVEAERFSHLISRYARLLTTTHVLTEVFKLRKYSELKRDAHTFMRFAADALRRSNVREVHCSLEDFSSNEELIDLACSVGLTDAALVFVSKREGCPILSDDTRLFETGWAQVFILTRELSSR